MYNNTLNTRVARIYSPRSGFRGLYSVFIIEGIIIDYYLLSYFEDRSVFSERTPVTIKLGLREVNNGLNFRARQIRFLVIALNG